MGRGGFGCDRAAVRCSPLYEGCVCAEMQQRYTKVQREGCEPASVAGRGERTNHHACRLWYPGGHWRIVGFDVQQVGTKDGEEGGEGRFCLQQRAPSCDEAKRGWGGGWGRGGAESVSAHRTSNASRPLRVEGDGAEGGKVRGVGLRGGGSRVYVNTHRHTDVCGVKKDGIWRGVGGGEGGGETACLEAISSCLRFFVVECDKLTGYVWQAASVVLKGRQKTEEEGEGVWVCGAWCVVVVGLLFVRVRVEMVLTVGLDENSRLDAYRIIVGVSHTQRGVGEKGHCTSVQRGRGGGDRVM